MPAGPAAQRLDHRHDELRDVQRGGVQLHGESRDYGDWSVFRHDSVSAGWILSGSQRIQEGDSLGSTRYLIPMEAELKSLRIDRSQRRPQSVSKWAARW